MFIRTARSVAALLLVGTLAGCGFRAQADRKFGDQHFKTAISLIELHKVRTGAYPQSLAELRFTGDWDPIAIQSVRYERTGAGYTLDLARGWAGVAELSYPPEFWQGLGIVSSNVAGLKAAPGGG